MEKFIVHHYNQSSWRQPISGKVSAILDALGTILSYLRYIKEQIEVPKDDPVLEFFDVCHFLRMSERQVHRLKSDGKLTGFLIGWRRLSKQPLIHTK